MTSYIENETNVEFDFPIKEIADSVTETEAANQRLGWEISFFLSTRSIRHSHSYNRFWNRKMPIIHPIESWKLTDVITRGFTISISSDANASSV